MMLSILVQAQSLTINKKHQTQIQLSEQQMKSNVEVGDVTQKVFPRQYVNVHNNDSSLIVATNTLLTTYHKAESYIDNKFEDLRIAAIDRGEYARILVIIGLIIWIIMFIFMWIMLAMRKHEACYIFVIFLILLSIGLYNEITHLNLINNPDYAILENLHSLNK